MTDLEDLLLTSQSLDDIDINAVGLPITNGMLVWHGLAFAERWLKNYLLDAPDSEKQILNKIQLLIENSQISTRDALSSYTKLFKCIETWYKQTDLNAINYNKALILLKSVDYVLKALAHDCRAISWPMSNWIPSSIYSEVNQLLELGKDKFELIITAKLKHKNKTSQPIKQLSAFDKMKRALDQGILNLMIKTSAVAEKKDSYEYLLNQFKQLKRCFAENGSLTMDNFWHNYSDKKLFQELMEALLLTQAEKKPWLRAYEYYRLNKPSTDNMFGTISQTLGSLYNMTNHGLLGAKLNHEILNKRVDQAIELLYKQVVDESLQHENTNNWLEQIDMTLQSSEENPLLNKLLTVQQTLQSQMPKQKISIENKSPKLIDLSNKANFTTQTRINDVSNIRHQLHLLLDEITKLQNNLGDKKIEMKKFIDDINLLRQLTTSPTFQLTNIDCNDFLNLTTEILSQLKQNIIKQLPESFNDFSKENVIEIYQKCNIKFIEQIKNTKKIINIFNDKGHSLRESSLKQIAILIKQQQGFVEIIFRFFSSNYRKCMVEIESLIRSEQSSLYKVNNILKQLNNTQDNSFYFVKQRLKKLSSSNRYGMFESKEDENDDCITNLRTEQLFGAIYTRTTPKC